MKQFTIIAVLSLAAGWCFAQGEDAGTDSVRVDVQVEKSHDTTTAVAVTTEKNQTDSITTIVIHDERDRPFRRLHSRLHGDWILGCSMNNLALQSFPGAVFLQRNIGKRWYAGLEIGCNYNHNGPDNSYSYGDSEIYQDERINWAVRCYPEFTRYLGFRNWLATVAIRSQVMYNYEQNTTTQIMSSVTQYRSISERESWTCGLNIPVGIERSFNISDMKFSAGLRTNILSLSVGRYKTRVKIYSRFMGDIPGTHSDGKIPLTLSANGPFSQSASILLKYWF